MPRAKGCCFWRGRRANGAGRRIPKISQETLAEIGGFIDDTGDRKVDTELLSVVLHD